jgi:hypothetical protein
MLIHSFIYSYSIDHTDVEFVIKYKYKQFVIKSKMNNEFMDMAYLHILPKCCKQALGDQW